MSGLAKKAELDDFLTQEQSDDMAPPAEELSRDETVVPTLQQHLDIIKMVNDGQLEPHEMDHKGLALALAMAIDELEKRRA